MKDPEKFSHWLYGYVVNILAKIQVERISTQFLYQNIKKSWSKYEEKSIPYVCTTFGSLSQGLDTI